MAVFRQLLRVFPRLVYLMPGADQPVAAQLDALLDLALGLIARGWGHFEDFEENMAARQPSDVVRAIAERVGSLGDLR